MNPQLEYDMLLKFVFLGPPNAGKTSLLSRITKNTFSQNYICTIGCDFATKYLEIDNTKIKAQLWDTAGQERFRTTVSSSYYRGACGVFLTFDLTSEQSFNDVQKCYQESMALMPNGVPVILVGCKSDLIEQRAVIYDIAQALANNLGLPYIETSAKANSNCIEVLEELSRIAITYVKNREQVQLQPQLKDLKDQQGNNKGKGTCC